MSIARHNIARVNSPLVTSGWFSFSVAVGRFVMRLVVQEITVHELYTAAFGLYVIWLVCRAGNIVVSWIPLGMDGIVEKIKNWTVLVGVRSLGPWVTVHPETLWFRSILL